MRLQLLTQGLRFNPRLGKETPRVSHKTQCSRVNKNKILKRLAAGRCGEFTAVNTYFYQYLVLKNLYPEIAEALRQISIVEMMHYEMLSEAIVDFGGDPTLTDGQGNVWTGRNVNRERDVRRILQDNIRAEENGIRRLELAASRVSNISLSELLLRIVEDEKNHILVLNNLLATL